MAEYIPFGANSIVTLNHHLGSTERVQGGFYTALVEDDEDQGGTKFEIAPGLTSINILDYTLAKHINLEADINLPEDEGIIQVETFGVSLNADGTTFYGLQVEAVMDRIRDNISLDHLSRLLVDIASDSSTIVDSIITAHQRDLLYYIFGGNKQQRDKVRSPTIFHVPSKQAQHRVNSRRMLCLTSASADEFDHRQRDDAPSHCGGVPRQGRIRE